VPEMAIGKAKRQADFVVLAQTGARGRYQGIHPYAKAGELSRGREREKSEEKELTLVVLFVQGFLCQLPLDPTHTELGERAQAMFESAQRTLITFVRRVPTDKQDRRASKSIVTRGTSVSN
jgi:hypothetical protein